MELVHASGASATSSARSESGSGRPPASARPAQLQELMASTNAAATIPAAADYAIWENACRLLAAEQRAAPVRSALAGPRTVIVVEHDAKFRETMRTALEAAGYRVLPVEDGAKGLAIARQHPADLVITAIEMPSMDGITFIGQVRELSAHRLTPIMMLATEAQSAKKIAGRRAGATGWIGKPFDPRRFIAIIQQVCPSA